MSDITNLAQAMKAAAEKAKHAGKAPVMPFDTRIAALNEYQITVCPDNVLAVVEALELKEEQRANWFQMTQKLGEDLDTAEKHIAELERYRTAYMEWSDKTDWVQGDKRFDVVKPLGKHRADVLKAYIDRLESRTVTIEPFRSFVTDADLAALHRFAECCDDPESGGHDLEKEQVLRLEAIGALRRFGCIHWITGFGDVLISITAGIKVEGE